MGIMVYIPYYGVMPRIYIINRGVESLGLIGLGARVQGLGSGFRV